MSPREQTNIRPGAQQASPRLKISTFVIIWVLLNLYLEIPYILPTGNVIGAFPLIVSAPFLMLWQRYFCKADIRFIIYSGALLLVLLMLSEGRRHILEGLLGASQFVVALILGVTIFKIVCKTDAAQMRSIVTGFFALICIGAFLEWAGPLRGVSDAFRSIVFSGSGYEAYANDSRDIEKLMGQVRPKLFTSEPSLLAIGFYISCVSSFLLAMTTSRFLILSMLCIIFYSIIGSPTVALTGIVLCVIFVIRRFGKVAFPLLALCAASILYLFWYGNVPLLGRFSPDQFGVDIGANQSVNIRLFLPFVAMLEVLSVNPLFGVGISGKSALDEISVFTFNPIFLVQNNIAVLFTYFGLIGAPLFFFGLVRFLKAYRFDNFILFAVVVGALSQSMGGFETPRFIGYVFFICAVLHIESSKVRSVDDSNVPIHP